MEEKYVTKSSTFLIPFRFVHTLFTILMTSFFGTFTNNGFGQKRVPRHQAISELHNIREAGLRDSERVVELWKISLKNQINQIGYEKYAILEQVFIAALDLGDEDLSCECLDQLLGKFHNSCRISRLLAMYLESKGGFQDAQNIYTKLIEDDPTNSIARKRVVAILKAQHKIPEAINELKQYLKIFMSDLEAWSELTDLYLTEGDYKHAAFCMEELILSNPSNHLYYQRYAEIKYTEGGIDNLEFARSYYAQACILCPNNLRSLYGLLLTCSALDNQLGKSVGASLIGNCKFALNNESNSKITSSTTTNTNNNGYTNSNASSTHSSGHNCTHLTVMPQALSNQEKNRKLAKWAAEQIQMMYSPPAPIQSLSS